MRPPRVTRRRFQLLWRLLLALSVPLGALYYLAFTEGGLQLIATALNGRLGPVTIALHGVSGTLARGVHVDLLVIDHRRAHIEVEDGSGKLAIVPLAWQTIRVPEAHARRVLVHVLPYVDDGLIHSQNYLPPLMRIDGEHASTDLLQIIAPSGVELDGTAVSATGSVYPDRVRIYSGALLYNGIQVTANGDVLAARSTGLRGIAHLGYVPPPGPHHQPPWTVSVRFDGDFRRTALDAQFTEPFVAAFHGEARDLSGHWSWQGHTQVQRLDVAAWGAGHALGLISGALEVEGDTHGFGARGALDAVGLHAGRVETDFAGSLSGRVLTVTRLNLRHAPSGTLASSTGTVDFASDGPQLALSGTWTHLRWPLADADAGLRSEQGTYVLTGQLPFSFTAQGQLRIADTLDVNLLQLDSRLGRDGMEARHIEIGVLGGRAQLQGSWPWSETANWQLRGVASNLNIAAPAAHLAGHIGFAVNASGRGVGLEHDLDVQATQLAGTIQGQRAQGQAQISRRGGTWLFDDVRLQLGTTHIALNGRLGAQVDLSYALDASDLGLLRAGAGGQVSAQGSIRGNLHDPTVMTSIRARELSWDGIRLARLDATVDFDPHGSGRADANVQLAGLSAAGRMLDQLSVRTAGTAADHSVEFQAAAAGMTLAVHGRGRYAAGQWQGQLARAEFSDGAALQMNLEMPSALTLTAEHLGLEEFCLHAAAARLCAAGQIDAAGSKVVVQAVNLPLRDLTAGLSPATDYEGTLSVRIDAAAGAAEPWHGVLDANLQDAAIARHFSNGRIETLKLGTGHIGAQLTERDLAATLALDAGAAGNLTGSVHAHGDDAAWRDWPLTGALRVETTAIGFIDSYVSEIDRASGKLAAQLTVAGTAAAPRLDGDLHLSQGELDAYQINLSLRDLDFDAQLHEDSLSFKASASAGSDGHASVDGSLSWLQGVPSGQLHLRGQDLRLINIPEARVDASPDVTVRLQGSRIDVHGQVTLPYARIEPADLANAVLPSSDEVIVGAHGATGDTAFRIFSDVTLVLGDRVTINTQGLSGRLSGSISVITDDTGINRGSGELKVEEGKYLAYGRNLDIERGRLLFSNGLIGDPGLDLRAVKTFPDIKAGVNVRGTLRQPRMSFFSDPEVSQSQIVSLLLAGGSLEGVQNTTDPSARSNAARSEAIMQGGAILAQQLGGRFDIEAGVEQDLGNETSLVLGRYLSPRLYVSYGIGLVEAINTIKMRYTIGDHWTIKTEAGTQRSADLVFTIEK